MSAIVVDLSHFAIYHPCCIVSETERWQISTTSPSPGTLVTPSSCGTHDSPSAGGTPVNNIALDGGYMGRGGEWMCGRRRMSVSEISLLKGELVGRGYFV